MTPVISFVKDFANKKIVVTSQFKAPLKTVWDAFTNSAITDKWFAPEPYKAITKEMHFKEGGRWLYYMLSPEGEKFWSIEDFQHIEPLKSYETFDAFSDENGNINEEMPRMKWKNDFIEENGITTVINTISGEEKDIRKTIEMGFEEGFKTALSQLNELLRLLTID